MNFCFIFLFMGYDLIFVIVFWRLVEFLMYVFNLIIIKKSFFYWFINFVFWIVKWVVCL